VNNAAINMGAFAVTLVYSGIGGSYMAVLFLVF
jgi:hypothetical protein